MVERRAKGKTAARSEVAPKQTNGKVDRDAPKKNHAKSPSSSSSSSSSSADSLLPFWLRPIQTVYFAIRELLALLVDTVRSLFANKLLLSLILVLFGGSAVLYTQNEFLAAQMRWYAWWVLLGVASSIGLGSGLHTFVLYLGPHIASVTLAAFECNSVDFPEPPYPSEIVCPSSPATSAAVISLWTVVSKVRWESLAWGAGTALGELPPYFVSRATRLHGSPSDLEELRELQELHASKKLGLMDRTKVWVEKTVVWAGFVGILLCASIPNPFFDLAGIICGYSLVPFTTFFGATLIGKALIKMHIQMLFVIVAFSAHHVETVVSALSALPYGLGAKVEPVFRDYLEQQKLKLHGGVEPTSNVVSTAMSFFATVILVYQLATLVSALAERFQHRRAKKTN